MNSKFLTRTLIILAVFGLVFSADAFAGKGKGKGKHKKIGFFHKIGHAIRHAGDHIVNGVMDTGVKIKKAITGKKNWVWVCGHYNQNGVHIKGHWRYVKHGCPGQGNPGQGNPGQGNPGQGQPGQGEPGQGGQTPNPPAPPEPPAPPANPGNPSEEPAPPTTPSEPPAPPSEPPSTPSEPPAPPEEPPAPPSEPPAPPEEPPAPPSEPPAPPSEPPAPEQPPAEPPAPPADNGQGGDQGGQAGQGGQSGQTGQDQSQSSGQKRTLGMLMKDLVGLSDDMDAVKSQALTTKKAKKAAQAVTIEADYQLLATDREKDAQTLIKVITDDLENNDGAPGIFYSAYLRNLKAMTKADRKAINDVTDAIKSNVRHNMGKSKKASPFKARFNELKAF